MRNNVKKTISIVTLAASAILFALGLWFPLLATKQQILGIVLKYQETTLFGSVRLFFDEKEYFIAAVIFLFTICLPIIKFIELSNRLLSFIKIPSRLKHTLQLLDKWSMLDVFLVAVLLLNFKMDSNVIVMKLKIGTTFIALSIILRLVSSHFMLIMNSKK
jgi:paraquat-inducible protein A